MILYELHTICLMEYRYEIWLLPIVFLTSFASLYFTYKDACSPQLQGVYSFKNLNYNYSSVYFADHLLPVHMPDG